MNMTRWVGLAARRELAGPAVRGSRAQGDACRHHRRHPVPRPGHRCEHGDLLIAGERPASCAGLPVPDADRSGHAQRRRHEPAVHVCHLRRDSTSRDHLFDGALAWAESALTIGEEAEPAYAQWVSGDFFRHPRRAGVRRPHVHPLADDAAGGGPEGPVAVISHGLWQRRFGGASDAIRPRAPRRGRAGDHCRRSASRIPRRAGGVGVRPASCPSGSMTSSGPRRLGCSNAPWLRILLRLRPRAVDGRCYPPPCAPAQPRIRSRSHPPGPAGAAFLSEPFVVETPRRPGACRTCAGATQRHW